MRSGLYALALAISTVFARDLTPVKRNYYDIRAQRFARRGAPTYSPPPYTKPVIKQTPATDKFKINGSAIPDVDFDIGEVYAGLLPISDGDNVGELYFFFVPSDHPAAEGEIVIWLNGGPGCSSLEGLMQENGPWSWQYGTYKPVKNPYTWTNLTNVVWIEQPLGTGFSHRKGTPPATNQIEVAEQFLGFWKNFIDTFSLQCRKIYITGESYAGYYISYIADAMHNQTNKEYYNIDSVMMYDPSLSTDAVQCDLPAVPFVNYWSRLFNLNASYLADLNVRYESCGYKEFLEQALTFPPTGTLPDPPDLDAKNDSCRLFNNVFDAALQVNPCWDVYQIAATCPVMWDVLGFPGSFYYTPEGAFVYFNRTDVQKAINAPLVEWHECTDGVFNDTSPPPALSVLPRVIEKNSRTIIAHGMLDMRLIANGTIIAIQNMTWHGAQGFSKSPADWNDFYVPYHNDPNAASMAGAGTFGKWFTERGLTFCTVELAGHMVPQFAPSAAYRQLEFLLGRVENLGVVGDFTTQHGDFGNGVNASMMVL